VEVASSAWQAYGIENSGIETRPDEDTRTLLIADAEAVDTEDVEGNRQERNQASPNPQPVLSGASAHLPTTTMVYLPPFEKSTPTPYRPDLTPNIEDQAEQGVLALKPTLEDLPISGLSISSQLSPTLDNTTALTLSHPDTVVGEQKERIDELLDDYKTLLAGPFFERTFAPAFPLDDTGAPPHLPTTTIVHLPAFEESTPTPYRPDLDPTSIDQEEQGVLALNPTLEDLPISGLPISSQLSPTLHNTTVLTLSQPDTVVGEQKERIDELSDNHKILLAGPFFERPRTALATPAQISSLGRSPYLDSAVFLLNPTTAGRDGQIGAKVLLSSVNPFGLGKFDIRDFMVPFREREHQQEASWESLSLLGPRDSLNDSFEVGLSGIGLGVLLFLMLSWPMGAIIGGLMRNRI